MEPRNNNNNTRRLPNVTLEIYEPGQVDQDLRSSAWFITINTNRAAHTRAEFDHLSEGLREVANELKSPEGLEQIIVFTNRLNVKGPARYAAEGRQYNLDDIEKVDSVEFRVRIEKSASTAPMNPNRVHMHIYMKVVHRSNIHLDQAAIKQIANNILVNMNYRVAGVYVHIRTANTGNDNIMRYLGKPQL